MKMQKHYMIIGIGVLLVLILYFGFSTRSKQSHQAQKGRALVAEVMSGDNLLREARENLSADQKLILQGLEQQMQKSSTDSTELLKRIAGFWYSAGIASASGVMAERIAQIEKTAESWAICGTTFALCLTQQTDERIRQFCSSKGRSAFENAISLDPESVEHRINLALTFVESPPEDNPMKGILMLRELNEANPENVSVLFQLAKLAVKTGQMDRALGRIEEGLKIDPQHIPLNCLAIDVYRALGKQAEAEKAMAICDRN
jgi:tetratricopeptide (TPR) repeat protein